MTDQDQRTAYVMVNLPSEQQERSSYVVSSIPFTEYKLQPGQRIQVDKLFTSYEALKEGLIHEFGIAPEDIPDPNYFDPTPGEMAYDEDPIFRVVPAEPEEMPWERHARRAVCQALEDADWDFDEGTVTIYDRDDRRIYTTVDSLEDLQTELEKIAENAFRGSVPWKGGPLFTRDSSAIAQEELEAYEENLKQLGWEL